MYNALVALIILCLVVLYLVVCACMCVYVCVCVFMCVYISVCDHLLQTLLAYITVITVMASLATLLLPMHRDHGKSNEG